jgi:hypothetical protein
LNMPADLARLHDATDRVIRPGSELARGHSMARAGSIRRAYHAGQLARAGVR